MKPTPPPGWPHPLARSRPPRPPKRREATDIDVEVTCGKTTRILTRTHIEVETRAAPDGPWRVHSILDGDKLMPSIKNLLIRGGFEVRLVEVLTYEMRTPL